MSKRIYATVKTSERSRKIWVWKCQHCFTGGHVVFAGRTRAIKIARFHVTICRYLTLTAQAKRQEQGAAPLYIKAYGKPGGRVETSTIWPTGRATGPHLSFHAQGTRQGT